MAEARIVLTTLSDEQQASDFAAALVERRLAACVNIVGPIRSIYRWKGKLERESEFLLIIKTTSEQTARLEAAFDELHPYELPERVELSVEGGSEAYLAWIAGEVQAEEGTT
jgi:periplasmic divalent cation tolerance protein